MNKRYTVLVWEVGFEAYAETFEVDSISTEQAEFTAVDWFRDDHHIHDGEVRAKAHLSADQSEGD